ncbi:MAG TPA: hypothetical protein VGQ57_08465 [Polyangiaceae bacterium]|jgi:hypothetical protein|nr:hypothetical protein [Polyangiaceae bacterium]
MTQTATLLLLFAGELTRGERASVDDFARKRQVELIAPAPTPSAAYPAYRRELVLDLEGRLDEARTLAASLDEDRALAVLNAIERELLAHPELPQAAWLLAERHRIAADLRSAAPGGAAEAAALAAEARALEGPRATAFGAETASETPAVRITVRVRDLDARDRLELDGESGGPERTLEPGVHQVRVLRGGELVLARWATFGDHPDVVLGVRGVVPCSGEDLGGASANGGFARGTTGVACPRYLLVRREAGMLQVADCAHAACTPFTPLAPPPPPKGAGFPPWATVALATAGTAATMVLLTWASGGFEHHAPPDKTVFVYGGLR